MMNDDEWFLLDSDGKTLGPFSADQLRRGLAAGKIPSGTLATRPGMSEWVDVASVGRPAQPVLEEPRFFVRWRGVAAHGPYSQNDLWSLLAEGRIPRETEACAVGATAWTSLDALLAPGIEDELTRVVRLPNRAPVEGPASPPPPPPFPPRHRAAIAGAGARLHAQPKPPTIQPQSTGGLPRQALIAGAIVLPVLVGIGAFFLVSARVSTPAPSPAATLSATGTPPQKDEVAEVRAALAGFKKTATAKPKERQDGYARLLEVVAATKSLAARQVAGDLRTSEAKPRLDRLIALDREQIADDAGLPTVPEKPEHDPPKYAGAFSLGGAVRKCYKDGVLLESNGKLYFVRNAVCPDTPLLSGWVQEAGETVTADIGRSGREAVVVTIADRESAADDRAAFTKAHGEYEAEYRAKSDAYRTATEARKVAERTISSRQKGRAAERERLEKDLDAVLLALASGVASASPSQAPSAESPPPRQPPSAATARTVDSPPRPSKPSEVPAASPPTPPPAKPKRTDDFDLWSQ